MKNIEAIEVQEAFSSINKIVEVKFRRSDTSDNLVVVFSQSGKISLANKEFDDNVLFIADRGQKYYVTHISHICNAIIILSENASNVLFLGGSKGGFGALLAAAVCARKARLKYWRALAFSPIVNLTGEDGSTVPSASLMRARGQKSPRMEAMLQRYGKIAPLIRNVQNLTATVVYPSKNIADSSAALSLAAPNVRLFPIYTSLHGTLYALLNRDTPPTVNYEKLKRIFRSNDPDIQATAMTEISDIVRDIHSMTWLPTFSSLVYETMRAGKIPGKINPLPRLMNFDEKFPKNNVN